MKTHNQDSQPSG